MNILMLTDVFYPDTTGGAGRVVSHLSQELGRKGHAVHILTRNTRGTHPDFESLAPNLFVYRFIVPAGESPALLFAEFTNSLGLAKKVLNHQIFDIICVHQSMAAMSLFFAGYFKDLPLTYFFHSPWHREYLVKKEKQRHSGVDRLVAVLMKYVEGRIIRNAFKAFVLSDYMGNTLQELHHYPPAKTVKVPGGVDLSRFCLPQRAKEALKSDLDLPENKTIFFTARNLVPRMGIEALVEAFSQSTVLREKAILLIAGEGFLKEKLLGLVRKGELEKTVQFLGYLQDQELVEYYQAADYFILPTKELEGFGLVILEAMACGTPVLGTPVGAIPEVLGAFDRNLLFQGTSSTQIKKKLEEVVLQPGKYVHSVETCRDYVEKNFSWEKLADGFLREVENLKT